MGMIIKPIPPNVLDMVRRKEVAVLDLHGTVIHIFGDYDQTGGDIVIRVYDDNKPSQQFSARDEVAAREIIGRIIMERVTLWQIAS